MSTPFTEETKQPLLDAPGVSSKQQSVSGELPEVVGSVLRAFGLGLPLIVLLTLVFAGIGYFVSTKVDPEYEASAKIIMLSKRLEDDRVITGDTQRPLILPPSTQDLISETHILQSTSLIKKTLSQMANFDVSAADIPAVTPVLFALRGTLEISRPLLIVFDDGVERVVTADGAVKHASNTAPEGVTGLENSDVQLIELAEVFDDQAVPVKATEPVMLAEDSIEAEAIEVSENLEVYIEPGSNIIVMNIRAAAPDYALEFLDRHLRTYLEYRDALAQDGGRIEILEDRVESLQRELAAATQERRNMLNESFAIEPDAEIELNWSTIRDELARTNELENSLRTLNSKLRVQRAELRNWVSTARYDMPLSGAGMDGSGEAHSYLFDLHRTLIDLSAKYKESVDVVVEARENFDVAKSSYIASLRNTIATTESDIAALEDSLKEKKVNVARLRSSNEELAGIQEEIQGLNARILNVQANYATALSSLEKAQAETQSGNGLSSVRVLQTPSLTSLEPVSFGMPIYVASGAALGFLLGLLLALLFFARPRERKAAA